MKKLPDADMKTFFESWSTIWRMKTIPEMELYLLTVDVHAPYKLRTNIILSNLEEFHESFNIKVGDSMYLAPEDRIVIW